MDRVQDTNAAVERTCQAGPRPCACEAGDEVNERCGTSAVDLHEGWLSQHDRALGQDLCLGGGGEEGGGADLQEAMEHELFYRRGLRRNLTDNESVLGKDTVMRCARKRCIGP